MLNWHTLQYYIHLQVSVTVSTVKNMGLAKQETCWWQKMDLTTCKQWCTGTDTTFTFTTTGLNDWTDLQIDCWLCLIRILQARLEIGNLKGLSISLGKQLSCKMQGTLEIGVFVAIANDLIINIAGKRLASSNWW